MKSRIPKSYELLPLKEKQAIHKAVYAEVAHKSAKVVVALAEELAKKRIGTTIECCHSAALLTLVDDLGFGTDAAKMGKRESRLKRFSDGFLETMNSAGEAYDEYMLAGINYQLHARGVDIETPEIKSESKTLEEISNEIIAKLQEEDKTP